MGARKLNPLNLSILTTYFHDIAFTGNAIFYFFEFSYLISCALIRVPINTIALYMLKDKQI